MTRRGPSGPEGSRRAAIRVPVDIARRRLVLGVLHGILLGDSNERECGLPTMSPGWRGLAAAALLLAGWTAGCGTEGGPAPAPSPCGFALAVAARIDVSERSDVFHGTAYSRVEATVQDGTPPEIYRVSREEGACRYLRPVDAFCDPPCPGGTTCAPDGTCRPYPASISGGTLTVRGLAVPVEVQPADWSPGTYVGPAGLPEPLFAAGDAITATLMGDAFPALKLAARGVASMDPALARTGFTMPAAADATLTWTPGPDPGACVQVLLKGSNAAHGLPLRDAIVCETTDGGSVVVPSSMVQEFPAGTTPEVTSGYDWPHSELTRYTRGVAQTAYGPAELMVRSTTYFLLGHAGQEGVSR